MKLGQPVPLSNLALDSNKDKLHAAQRKVPFRFSSLSGLENGRSVASSKSTAYAFGGSSFRHSSSGFLSGSIAGIPCASEAVVALVLRPHAENPNPVRARVPKRCRKCRRCIHVLFVCRSIVIGRRE